MVKGIIGSGALVDFTCNVCGQENRRRPLALVENRETQSCTRCSSSLRMRSLVHWLSVELFGTSLTLPRFPVDKSIRGLGMSDWEGYARELAVKFDYRNTFYDREPRLDITRIREAEVGRYRFVVSSDVFEHVPVGGLDAAFRNVRRLLGAGGVFIFTVPFAKHGETVEHFPGMNDFRIVERDGRRVLLNRTAQGVEQVFESLVFHGGDGMTLEMRHFSEPDLLRRLRAAGFCSVRVCPDHVPEYGILWPMDWAVPIVARA
jgi:SAM-dependent methyltransferase